MSRNPVLYKSLVVGVIVLFIGVGVQPVFAINNPIKQIPIGKTLYVGGSGEGNYTSIQDAIDNASSGDTVFVYDDSSPYYENLVINISINLVGENQETTLIKNPSQTPLIKVKSDNVLITNFKIHQDAEYEPSIKTDLVKNIEICNMFFNKTYKSSHIHIYRTTSSKIHDNIIRRGYYGIRIEESQDATIYNNEISYTLGIYVINSDTIKIYNNYLHNNTPFAIWARSNSVNISSNLIINNQYGIVIASFLESNIIITNNNISYNEYYGMIIYKAYELIVSYNQITNNEVGVFIVDEVREFDKDGILPSQKRTHSITCNNFIDNERHADFIYTWPIRNQITQTWDKNYWNRPISYFKILRGRFFLFYFSYFVLPFYIPWFKFDRNPAQEPYDIEV